MKVSADCQTCAGSTRKGLLWLGGGDWLECPDCGGTGVFTYDESRVQARVQDRYLPMIGGGLRKQTKILFPHGWTE